MSAIDWSRIDLVVFDVDGTLYDQGPLRRAMLARLLADALRRRSLDTLRVLGAFRRVREALGDEENAAFMTLQYSRAAEAVGCDAATVEALTSEWMEHRPLPLLAGCRYPHLDRLFLGLQARGKQVAVLSDYPATNKLAALGLQAHPVVCATDPDIARLKPDPQGLLSILRRTGVAAQRALMIGDRFDRDGLAAERAQVRALIRSRRPHPRFDTFRRYDDPVFRPMLAPEPMTLAAGAR